MGESNVRTIQSVKESSLVSNNVESKSDSTTKSIKLNISNWRRPAPNTIPWDTKASGLYMICTLSKNEAEKQGYTDS